MREEVPLTISRGLPRKNLTIKLSILYMKSVCLCLRACVRRCSGSIFYGRTGHRDNRPAATSDHDSNHDSNTLAWLIVCRSVSRTCPGPETQALRANYRGSETEVLRAKCINTHVYCTLLCENTAVVRPFYLFEVTYFT